MFYPYRDRVAGDDQDAAARPTRRRSSATNFRSSWSTSSLRARTSRNENDIIYAKSLPGTKKKERANLPNEFITNDDFCPGCGLELKSMPIDQTNLYADVFQRDMDSTLGPGQPSKAALLSFSGWGLERQLGPERQALVQALRDDIDAMRKALPEKFPYVHGVRDVEKPVNLKVGLRGSPYRFGDDAPRGFLSVLSGDEPVRSRKAAAGWNWRTLIVHQPIAIRVIVNRIWKGHFGTGIVDTPSNFGVNGERPTHPELLEYLAQYFVDHGMSIKALHREIMLSAVYQSSDTDDKTDFDKDSGNRLYWRFNRHRMTAEQIRDSVLIGVGRAREQDGRAVGAAHAAVSPPHHLRARQPLQARRVPAALRLSEPEPERRKALHDQCPAAAAVLHEQRLHAAARRAARGACAGRADRRGSHPEVVSPDLRTRGDARRSPGRQGVSRDRADEAVRGEEGG